MKPVLICSQHIEVAKSLDKAALALPKRAKLWWELLLAL